MGVLLLGLAIVIADLGLKQLLLRAQLRTVTGRLWLVQLQSRIHVPAACALWALLAAPLVALGVWLPAFRVPVCLLLAGSASNLLEHATRGTVTDYVCLRGWPAFNLADVALTAGAVSLLATSLP